MQKHFGSELGRLKLQLSSRRRRRYFFLENVLCNVQFSLTETWFRFNPGLERVLGRKMIGMKTLIILVLVCHLAFGAPNGRVKRGDENLDPLSNVVSIFHY